MVPSGGLTTTLPWPGKRSESSLGGGLCLFWALKQPVAVGCTATVLPPARFRHDPAVLLELPQGPLDGGPGEVQVFSDGSHRGPAAALGVRPVLQIHIDRHVPVGQLGGIDCVEVSHRYFSKSEYPPGTCGLAHVRSSGR